ncbi:chromosome segregation protein SMC [Thiomicrospira sp. R3]|uniref:chromosome segregation protein SMC n=1 Tax=Thiomicrospira sp. R3 TaxID=3035472 RepID=UPI00259B205E|nr:chromosome segregation protein SMC [Thiomicrospira sp. R3]WFE68558.1 chromosome segregation protein SMC [Thiomicrospira sp. R3]
MRLKLIKIAGFKSFVEPIKLVLPSELVGVVGPNGCGKSNTLDAVRWVMGESSARELRGGDMNDVLFNGSDKRKAVSQCSVELLFDNESGMAGGAYASYSEISVKRVHHREEGTRYFLNQQACRRRDIIDLFNGTGLGPRSYALIGQGNISRIIEAKPEDMRIYLEEVAGIGPYRSRRKETLVRLNRTGENLAQLNVLQDALIEQAEHLEIQAEKARDHRQATQRLQALEKTLYYQQWHALHQQQTRTQSDLRMAERAFADSKSNWDQQQKTWLLLRQEFANLQTELEQLDAEYHQLDKQVDKLEQQQHFSGQQSQQWLDQRELNQQQITMHQAQLDELNQQLTELVLDGEAMEEQVDRLSEQLEALDASWSSLIQQKTQQEQVLQRHQLRAQQVEQAFKDALQQLKSIEQNLEHLAEQRELMTQHAAQAALEEEWARCESMETQKNQLDDQILATEKQMAELSVQKDSLKETLSQLKETYQTHQAQLMADRAEYQSLEKVQQRLVSDGERRSVVSELNAQPLISQLAVTKTWQTAVEAWLGERLQGWLLQEAKSWSDITPVGELGLLGWNPPAFEAHPQSLAAQIHQPALIRFLARDIYIRNTEKSIEQQLLDLRLLTDKQAWLIDQHGVLYSDYLCMPPLGSNLTGSLERQERIGFLSKKINNLEGEVKSINHESGALLADLTPIENSLLALSEQRQEIQRQAQRLGDQIEHAQQIKQAWQLKHQASQHRIDQLLERQQKAAQQQTDWQLEQEALNEQLEQLDEQEEQASQALSRTLSLLMPIERERERLENQYQRLDQQRHQQQQAKQQLHFQVQQLQQQLKQDQLQSALIERHLSQAEPVDQQTLVQLIEQRDNMHKVRETRKHAFQTLKSAAENAEKQAEEAQQQHHLSEQHLVTHQIQLQAIQQQIHQLQKTVEAQGLSFYQLAQLRLDDQPIEQVEAELKQVKLHLNRLGAVNMTAIEEFEQITAKLNELNKQLDDLVQSIEVLEQAIAHIDQDSRTRLVDTFEHVNQGFNRLFPSLFRGGEASLSWLDPAQDPLEGGVMVMARPPGKRNSRIQLLSGGEKTLSALALIFAIFELKPAPFCILDEVDAPLDDSNVIRFCGLVRSLSEKVQFIFITHNKTTMALAKHLVGVTMHEPGVSRLVSVDLDAAVEMIGD